MYSNLLDMHHDGGLERSHDRRFYYKHLMDANEDITDCKEWCIEHLDIGSWTWGWDMGKDPLDQGYHVFTFRREEDALLFALTWQ